MCRANVKGRRGREGRVIDRWVKIRLMRFEVSWRCFFGCTSFELGDLPEEISP